ncbi:mevalonate kinase [Weissella thailandensis]|uniref:Mevalonate kinase n=1 Tax=Weissella thailandensis TaxID=89061 RepID=A0ABX9I6H7_9LACO|nr:mevalonate kinase [Weissella thailandensis]NKY90181.1 mevalonate kinase [Weissella thailandensis]RDS60258.1 mevalonate kinase [Weissella thailandensis]GEP74083.1 mevalonate kinase [Weissella thailandensis]
MKKPGIGVSHAKVILLGEHAVVYGQPAIALPLTDLAMTVKIESREAGQVVLSKAYQGPLVAMAEVYEGIRQLINRLLKHFRADEMPFTMTITSNIPQERGMGSSAATAIAIVRAFFNFFDEPLPKQDLQRWASIEESITHGSPSGLDTATVAHDEAVWFIKGQQPEKIDMSLDGTLILADTGIQGQTGLAISVVRENLTNDPETGQHHIDQIGEIAKSTRTAIAENNLVKIGNYMNEAQSHLSALGISHPKLDELINAARHAGALGAKLTGGGVGGTMIALTTNGEQTTRVIKALEDAGAQEVWTQNYTNNK